MKMTDLLASKGPKPMREPPSLEGKPTGRVRFSAPMFRQNGSDVRSLQQEWEVPVHTDDRTFTRLEWRAVPHEEEFVWPTEAGQPTRRVE